jgi:hypothetical protein
MPKSKFYTIFIIKSHPYSICHIPARLVTCSTNWTFCLHYTAWRYLNSKFHVIWTLKSRPYSICPISSTSSNLFHKLNLLFTFNCSKILISQISCHMDLKNCPYSICHIPARLFIVLQTELSFQILLPQDT